MELVMPFGAMTLEEAADILHLDREVLFKKLADPDPQTLKDLIGMIDTDKLDQHMASHGADDIIKMLEATPEVEEEDDDVIGTAITQDPNASRETLEGESTQLLAAKQESPRDTSREGVLADAEAGDNGK